MFEVFAEVFAEVLGMTRKLAICGLRLLFATTTSMDALASPALHMALRVPSKSLEIVYLFVSEKMPEIM